MVDNPYFSLSHLVRAAEAGNGSFLASTVQRAIEKMDERQVADTGSLTSEERMWVQMAVEMLERDSHKGNA